MSIKYEQSPQKYQKHISESSLSIYDRIEIGDPDLWIPTPELEILLDEGLKGLSLQGLPLRTRSKVVKQEVCRVLGYPVPSSFRRTQPRFPGQVFDIYVQKSNNLQIWNEEISPTRRYVIIRVSTDDTIERVKVITGDTLARFDTTGTLTQKYQARLIPQEAITELITSEDTDNLKSVLIQKSHPVLFDAFPTDYPSPEVLLPIAVIFERLKGLVDSQFTDVGFDQERNRGAQLHQLICKKLGYQDFRDDGRFPDIRNQLIEVKLQTSPTIDLGLVRPDSEEPLDIPKIDKRQIRHCDVRYALFYASTDGEQVTLTHFFLTTGEVFFTRFPQFQGKTLNKKLQIPLPSDFFA
ncbi:restriction endonuclease [Candidatus Dojkabacteria bacterium]|nr:restriction endonuclease [Candidatus Dojkabacteria bacterium]